MFEQEHLRFINMVVAINPGRKLRRHERHKVQQRDYGASSLKTWQDKPRRLEAHGDEDKLAPVFTINASRMIMTGRAKDIFEIWEADRDETYAAKS